MNFTINDLKKKLGGGLSTNKYLLELTSPIFSMDSATLNTLCKSARFPERSIATTEMWRYGRKYNLRGETQYGDKLVLTFLDDDKATVRAFFDEWLELVDDSGVSDLIDIASFEKLASTIKGITNGGFGDFAKSILDRDSASALAEYQSNLNVWALNSKREKVYGYKLQNCYPTSVGEVAFSDDSENKLVEFDVTFTFSEFLPIKDQSLIEMAVGTLIGSGAPEITMEDVFD